MRSGNKATVTKDSIFTLCHYCISLIGSHWDVTTLPPKPSRSLRTYVFAPSVSVTLCLSIISCALPTIRFLLNFVRPVWDHQVFHTNSFNPAEVQSDAFSVLPAPFKVSMYKDANQDVSDHHRNDKVSTSALTWHLWLLLVMPLGQTPPTDSSQLDSTANGRLNVKLVLRMSIALSLHLLDTFFSCLRTGNMYYRKKNTLV